MQIHPSPEASQEFPNDKLRKVDRSKYIDRYMGLKCQPYLKKIGLFPKIREVTETLAILDAVEKLKIKRNRKDVLFISVGDGVLPRTACMAAYLTQWTCVGIDPSMASASDKLQRAKALVASTSRLYIAPYRVEKDWLQPTKRKIDFDPQEVIELLANKENKFKTVVFAFVHSHASVEKSLHKFKHLNCERHIISMPCCFEDGLAILPEWSYEDPHVVSPKRKIHIYRDLDAKLATIKRQLGREGY